MRYLYHLTMIGAGVIELDSSYGPDDVEREASEWWEQYSSTTFDFAPLAEALCSGEEADHLLPDSVMMEEFLPL